MQYTRFSTLAALVLISSLAQAEVRVEGPVEYGVFASNYQDFQEGERVLTRSNQQIEPGEVIPAKLGTKFGMRYTLLGKVADGSVTDKRSMEGGKAGVTAESLSRFERGRAAEFGSRKLLAVLAVLGMELNVVPTGQAGTLDELRRERNQA